MNPIRKTKTGVTGFLAVVGLAGLAAAANSAAGTITHDLVVERGSERLNVRLVEPDSEHLARRPLLLLNFSTDRTTSLTQPLYAAPAVAFLKHGHRALSFDLPSHGERMDEHGIGIEGMRNRLLAGRDPFQLFVDDGKAVIDECIRRGWAEPGRIVVCGVSRAAYCALRLAAADPRISAVVGLAPVTDWRALSNFRPVKDRPEVAAVSLEQYAAALAGRRVYLAIGNADRRVGTETMLHFAYTLAAEEARLGLETSRLRILVVDDSPGHSIDDRWRDQGIEFLLQTTAEK